MTTEPIKPYQKILTCALCTSPWVHPFSPGDCPVCRKSSFAIVRVSYIGLGLGDEKCPSCANIDDGPFCNDCAGENYGATAGCSNWTPRKGLVCNFCQKEVKPGQESLWAGADIWHKDCRALWLQDKEGIPFPKEGDGDDN
jgi:hypothetical protein